MCSTVKRTLKNKTKMETQTKFHKVMTISAGLYGSKKWVLTEKNRIQEAKMRFLRAMLETTRQDKSTNDAIMKTFKVNSLNDTISKYTDNWFNHLTCIDHSHFP
jgi:hypothetical protein